MNPEATEIQKIQNNGNRPEDWLEFLTEQRTRAGPDLSNETCQHLIFLYERAVTQISAEENKGNFSYARLLVECAKLQMRISEDDARRTFQLARSNAKHFAIVFVVWAQFELLLGNKSKCRGLLRKGKEFEAQPKELLIKAFDNFVEGKKILIDDREELTGFTDFKGKQKSSESSVDSSPLSTGEDTSSSSRFTDTGTSKVADNTSAVISFKLPSVVENCGKQPLGCRRSISSSSDEADTIPFQQSHTSHLQRGCHSTHKPSVKSTPDVKSGTNSLAACMNLSVRRKKTRRDFGLPVRVKMTLPSVKEPGDDLDGISLLESTVDEPKQSSQPEMISRTQEKAPVSQCGPSSGLVADRKIDENPPVEKSCLAAKIENAVIRIAPKAPQDVIVVKGKSYQKLGTIGKGGSSKVYQVYDGKRICALKYVNLEEADDFIVQSYVNEIDLLKRLQGNDNIIRLFDWELSQEKSAIILVMECGSIDLAGFLRKNRSKMSKGELQGFWRQMLEAVHVVHQQGIIHSDLKPANFLLVEARLKLIDFGIARTLQGDKTSIELDTQVGTLNFMSPEAFEDISPRFDSAGNAKPKMKIGRPSDVWSLGCILYMMVYGRTPFQHITNHLQKLQCIMDPSHVIEFPDINDKLLLDVMEGCLRRNPKERYTIPQLLCHPFINSSAHGNTSSNTSSFSDPMVEIDSDRMFDCLMEFAKADVNSPRSIRALSQNFLKQLRAGNKISVSSAVPGRPLIHGNSQHAVPSFQAPGPALRQPLVGIDVQALNHAQKALKPPHASGNDKYIRWNTSELNKQENANLNVVLKRELAEKYRNAIPLDISESTFEQSWNTTTGRETHH